MPRKKPSTGIALPWENRGATIRRIFAASRSRSLVALFAIAAGAFVTYQRSEQRRVSRETRESTAEVEHAVTRFRMEIGRCPRSLDELLHPPRAGTRYLRATPLDGHGRPLIVHCPAPNDPDAVEVASSPPDEP